MAGYIYHGIGTNLLTMLGIRQAEGIWSVGSYEKRTGRRLQTPHAATTAGADAVSVAIKPSRSFEQYIRPGLSFVIDPSGLSLVDRRGQLEGERYVADGIPASHVRAIYVPAALADTPISHLDVCMLSYGSTRPSDRVAFLLELGERLGLPGFFPECASIVPRLERLDAEKEQALRGFLARPLSERRALGLQAYQDLGRRYEQLQASTCNSCVLRIISQGLGVAPDTPLAEFARRLFPFLPIVHDV